MKRLAAVLAGCAVLALCQAAYAQPVVQPLPPPEAAQLNEALRALSRSPQSLPALLSAGQASLALDDPESALGFFRRAEAVAPQDGQVKAGIAGVLVRRQQPIEALRLYAEAEQAGTAMAPFSAERGLAYDLVGDNTRAQAAYRLALQLGENPAVIQRLALSQAIGGDQPGSEATLLPLLQRSDLGAYRTRAFALAVLGKPDEAVTIAETMLPARLSGRMAPYLRYMPRLTRAQQAAAGNLGAFPSAGDIGRDDPAILAYAAQPAGPALASAAAPVLAAADVRLAPTGVPLGAATELPPENAADAARRRPGSPAPAPAVVVAQAAQPERVFARPAPAPAVPSQVVQASTAPIATPAAPVASAPLPRPSLAVGPAPAAPATAPAPTPTPAPPPRAALADAFAEFRQAGASPAIVAPAAGAVDITKIEPSRPAPPPAAKPAPPKPPPVPSRHWVQIATGREVAALAFDWRRLKREAGGLLDRTAPNTARWGQTNRLVVGPFATPRAADELIGKLKDKKLDSFRFTSAVGEDVKPLD